MFRLIRHDLPMHFVYLLTNWLPDNVVFLRLRGAMMRPFFGACGPDLRVGRHVCFYNPSNISLGAHIYVAYGCWFMPGASITVEDEVIFGPYAVVVASTHTRRNGSFRYGKPKVEPIVIRKGSWIASHATITAGVEVGEGSLVAAGSVVTSGVHRNTIVGGVPAKLIKISEDAIA